MDYTAREDFASNPSAVVLGVVSRVMVRFVHEVAPGTQKSVRKLYRWSKWRRSRSGVTDRFMKVSGCSNVGGDNLRRDHPTGGLIDARSVHFHWQQLYGHSLHASDKLCTSKTTKTISSTLSMVQELNRLTGDTVWTRVQTLDRRERSAFIVRHDCVLGTIGSLSSWFGSGHKSDCEGDGMVRGQVYCSRSAVASLAPDLPRDPSSITQPFNATVASLDLWVWTRRILASFSIPGSSDAGA